jgi:hypothetical protein
MKPFRQPTLTEPESSIQSKIAARAALEGAEVLQFAKVGARPKCPKCGAVVGRIVTQEPGLPDVLTIWPGHHPYVPNNHIWFEVKKPGEKPNPAQVVMRDRLRKAGDAVYIVDSEEGMLAALELEGVRLRTDG